MAKRDAETTPPRGRSEQDVGGPSRRRAVDETDRLTNMATALGAGVALVPVPGTSAALTGMDLLLIGAIGRIWGQPMTTAYVEGIFATFMAELGVIMGLHVVGDAIGMIPGIGTLLKPAVAAGCIKFIGSYLRERFVKEKGAEFPAAITAEEARARIEKATARMAVYGPDLADGARQAFKGNGKKLARTLNRIFGLDEPAS